MKFTEERRQDARKGFNSERTESFLILFSRSNRHLHGEGRRIQFENSSQKKEHWTTKDEMILYVFQASLEFQVRFSSELIRIDFHYSLKCIFSHFMESKPCHN